MIASVMIYLGALLAVAGLVMLVPVRSARSRRRLAVGLLAAFAGTAFALLGAGLPSRDVVVTSPRSRLDAIMPRYQFRERHVVRIAALPLAVDHAVRVVPADEIRYYRLLTWIRRLGRRAPEGLMDAPRGLPILQVAMRSGFHELSDEPGREIVLGVAGPASRAARAAAIPGAPRPFTPSADGYVSIAISFHITQDGDGRTVLETETRVFAPDAETRRRLATYWRVILPGSALIRRSWLDAIRRRAEGDAP